MDSRPVEPKVVLSFSLAFPTKRGGTPHPSGLMRTPVDASRRLNNCVSGVLLATVD